MQTSDSIKSICGALYKVQGEIHGVARDSQNPHFKNRYASLEAVIEAAKPALQKHGVVFVQGPGRIREGNIEVTTRLLEIESAEWIETTMEIPLAKNDPQGAGSAITYALRYSLMATLGLPPVDDDAEAAVGRPALQAAPTPRPATTKADNKDAEKYVDAALAIARTSKSERELTEWWKGEKDNRDKFNLSPDTGPGRKLMDGYADMKAAFQSNDLLMAG